MWVRFPSPAFFVAKNNKAVLLGYEKMIRDYVCVDIETTGIDTGSASKIIDTVTRNVLKDYDGYFAKSSGVQSYLDDAFSGLFVALIVSIFLLFMVMACQFESLLKPLVIMASIPLSFTCLLYTSPSPRDRTRSRMPSSA